MGWALRVPSILCDLLMGSCWGMAISIMACLVTSWITIIDGGKSKRTPKWAQALRYTASITIFITEIGMTFVERRVGHASNYDLAANGCFALLGIRIFFRALRCCRLFLLFENFGDAHVWQEGYVQSEQKDRKAVRHHGNLLSGIVWTSTISCSFLRRSYFNNACTMQWHQPKSVH